MRNLPESVTTEALAEVFGKFGALRGAQPVSIKRSKEKEKDTFAFVDFQEPAAQQAAIAGPATLDGQQVTPSCPWSLCHETFSRQVSLQASWNRSTVQLLHCLQAPQDAAHLLCILKCLAVSRSTS